MRKFLPLQRLLPVLALAAALLLPLVVGDSYWRHLFIVAFIYATVASNWDLSLGYAGVFNFGHVAFFGIGVYGTGVAAKFLGVDPWLAMALGGVAASFAGAVVALPVLRLKGIYVILVTFAFSQLVLQVVLSQSEVTGGTQGLVRIPTISAFGYNFLRDYRFGYYYVALALLVLSTVFLRRLVGSNFGMSLRALRDNEDYALARGIPTGLQRLKVLVASAFFTGVAGGFYAVYLRVASPEVFGFSTVSLVLSMVLVGGIATIYGPIVAAVLLTLTTESLAHFAGMNESRFMLVAVLMLAILLFLPRGLASFMPEARPDTAAAKGDGGPVAVTAGARR
jgi:branched-chain amino acid transport system permease protein